MTMRANALITADASQAKTETRDFKKEVDAAKTSVAGAGEAANKAAPPIKAVGANAQKTAASFKAKVIQSEAAAASGGRLSRIFGTVGSAARGVWSPIAGYVQRLRGIDDSQKLAGGSVANLTAQFNDIGVMMAAGQDPMQLAIQQGTQITQVFGNRGAASAVRALGSAFVSMLSPINLITIGSIAAGAAMVQWLTKSEEQAESLEDKLTATADAVKAFEDNANRAKGSAADLLKEFGTAGPEVRQVLKDMAALGKLDAYKAIDKTSKSLRDLVLDLSIWDDRSSTSASMDFLGLSSIRRSARRAGLEFARNLELLKKSSDPAEKLKAALDLRKQLLDTAGGLQGLNDRQRPLFDGLNDTIRNLVTLGAKTNQLAPEIQAARAYYESRKRGEEYLKNSRKLEIAELAKIHSAYARSRTTSDAAASTGAKMLAELREQAALQEAINTYGEDSARVADLRAEAERKVLEEKLASLPISEDLKDQIRAALENAQALARTDMAGNLSAAAVEARRVADEIIRAVEASNQLSLSGAASLEDSQSRLTYANDPVKLAGVLARAKMRRTQGVRRDGAEGGELAALDAEVEAYGRVNEKIAANNKARTDALKSQRAGGRASAKNAQGADRLIERLRQELAVMRELDPVQKELARNRSVLDGASAEQRQTIEELISARVREQKAAQSSADLIGLVGQSTNSVLDAMSQKGAKAADIMRDLAVSLVKAYAQAQLLGTGPLAAALGTAGGGGWIGTAFGPQAAQQSVAALPGYAEGGGIQLGGRAAGLLNGIGGPRQDNILFWGSNGEFMQPAATVDYYGRDFMEALRQRKLPRFANGGSLGRQAATAMAISGAVAGSGDTSIVFNDYSSGVAIEKKETRDADGNRSFEFELSDRVGAAVTKPGGGAGKALRRKYGLGPKGTKR